MRWWYTFLEVRSFVFGIVNVSVDGGTLGWCSKSAGKTLHRNYILSFAKAFHGEQIKKRAEALTFLMRLLLPPAEEFALHPSQLCVIKYIESARHTYPPPEITYMHINYYQEAYLAIADVPSLQPEVF